MELSEELKTDVFTLSIEPMEGDSYQYGFHLGTDEKKARIHATEIWAMYANRDHNPKGCRTVALKLAGKIVDVFDGKEWTSELGQDEPDTSGWKLWCWDEISNELTETTWEEENAKFQEDPGWLFDESWPDGTVKLRTDRHTAFLTWAPNEERAHAKLLKHKEYLEMNETEA